MATAVITFQYGLKCLFLLDQLPLPSRTSSSPTGSPRLSTRLDWSTYQHILHRRYDTLDSAASTYTDLAVRCFHQSLRQAASAARPDRPQYQFRNCFSHVPWWTSLCQRWVNLRATAARCYLRSRTMLNYLTYRRLNACTNGFFTPLVVSTGALIVTISHMAHISIIFGRSSAAVLASLSNV